MCVRMCVRMFMRGTGGVKSKWCAFECTCISCSINNAEAQLNAGQAAELLLPGGGATDPCGSV